VLWKHATSALLPAWVVFKILREAGLPDGLELIMMEWFGDWKWIDFVVYVRCN
jgi:hypothetical protein